MKILKPYIIELAKTLSAHYYNVWRVKANGSKGRFVGVFPSVTTYLNAFPTSEQLVKWVAEQGFHESRQIRDAAGRAGTKIHLAIEDLIKGMTLEEVMYTTEEWVKLESFVAWYEENHPEIIATELAVFSKKGKYAGRIDCIAKVAGEITVLDWKSSKSIHDSFACQLAAYAHAVEENTDVKVVQTAVVQLGASNKNGYRFVVYPDWRDHYKVFENVRNTWKYALSPKEIPVLELPSTLKLKIKDHAK